MFDLLEMGIEVGEKNKAEYVELRCEDAEHNYIGFSDSRVDTLNQRIEAGVGCRVLCDGAWGFSCGNPENIERIVRDAASLAKNAAKSRKTKIELKDVKIVEDEVLKKFKIHPKDVLIEEKVSKLEDLYKKIKEHDERITAVSIKYRDGFGFKYLLTSEGTRIRQEIGYVWNYCWVTGKGNGLTAARDEVGSTYKGFEYFEEESNEKIAERVSKRVLLQLEGVRAKGGSYPCVLGPRVVGVLAHEALGHLAEADLTLNSAFGGKLGEKVASEGVYMIDNPKEEFFGVSKYDDEGVEMKKVDIIKDSILTGLLTDREYAQKTSLEAVGASRAEDWRVSPLIRMRSTYFEKGDYSQDELFEGIDFGYYCVDFRGGQAELSSSFQVGVQEVFEISKGEISKPVKDLSISGIATEALKLIEGVSREMDFEQGRCGKGQEAFVSSGGPHLRVKKGGIVFGGR